MGAVTTSLTEQARSIFADLGYTVSQDGAELRAERKWRVVHVTTHTDPDSIPSSGNFRCFVTRADSAVELRSTLARADPDYEWAVIAVRADGEYDVLHAPTAH
ncbi:MAG: hypothetical protein ABEH35_08040 [Haloarculaceae archaeon]